MSYTVGLDFGTHQTKICVEDATNPAQKIYEFFEFETPNGVNPVLFPSIVQINKDDTVSYGFVDEINCKTIIYPNPVKPVLTLPHKPEKLPYPQIPQKKDLRGHSIKEQLLFQLNYEKYIEDWRRQCDIIDGDYCINFGEYQKNKNKKEKDFEISLAKWEKDCLPKKQIYRYFKLATFSKQQWEYSIEPEKISVWYLTFVLFKLQEKYGNDFFTQMGVPCSMEAQDTEIQINIAYKILKSANQLISKYENIDNFLKAKYTDLLQNTELVDCSAQDIIVYGINVLPEAFAGLSSITQQGKLGGGMHLLIDIGGGTTDIAFFTIAYKEKLPNIHAVISFPQGLNYIFEEYIKENDWLSMSEVQQLFRNNQENFEKCVSYYHRKLKDNTDKMILRVVQEFLNKRNIHGFNVSPIRNVLQDRPIVYCGGGSMYDLMMIKLASYDLTGGKLASFTEKKLIDKELLNILYMKNKDIDVLLFPILATSYGLSIPLENEITMTPIEKLFDTLPQRNEKKDDGHNEYGLLDT